MTDWTRPVAVKLPADRSPFGRLIALLGHHDFRVFLTKDAYIDVGAGSLGVLERLSDISGTGRLGSIGRFCEVNPSARIIVSGEHDNDNPVNVTFAGLPVLIAAGGHAGLKPAKPFSIGSGVVISANAIVLAGADIGDGVVIGAGAVVTRRMEAYGVYAGVPARRIKDRPSFAPWWNFEVSYLLENQARLNTVALASLAHRYRTDRPAFALNMIGGAMDICGFIVGDQTRPLTEAPERVTGYILQAIQSEKPYWLADCWAEGQK